MIRDFRRRNIAIGGRKAWGRRGEVGRCTLKFSELLPRPETIKSAAETRRGYIKSEPNRLNKYTILRKFLLWRKDVGFGIRSKKNFTSRFAKNN